MQYLQQAVQPLPDLRAIKGTAETLYKALKKDLSYEDYFDLLSSAAQTYDLQHSKRDPRNLRRSTRHVYAHDVDTCDTHTYDTFFDANEDSNGNENPFDFSDDYELNFHNIDTPIYELNATRRLDPSTQLPKHIYQHLDVTGKRAWIALPDALKRHIVKHLPAALPSASISANPGTPSRSLGTQQRSSPRRPSSFGTGSTNRSVNFTDTDATNSTCPNSSFDSFVDAFKAFYDDRQHNHSSSMPLSPQQHQQNLEAQQHQIFDESQMDADFFDVMQARTRKPQSYGKPMQDTHLPPGDVNRLLSKSANNGKTT